MLRRLSVGTKVALGFAAILLILAISTGATYYSVWQESAIALLVEATGQKTVLSAKLDDGLDCRISGIRGFLLTGKEKERNAYEKAKEDFAKMMEELRPLQLVETSAELRRLVEQFKINASGAAGSGHASKSRAAHA
jgi:CHASE3 domain sensor protein